MDPSAAEVKYNPKYEELFAPELGPTNPFKTQQQAAKKNNLAGYVENAHVNEFQFETQRRTFQSYKFAYDPSTTDSTEGEKLIGDKAMAVEAEFKTVFEDNKERPLDKRKRAKNTDASDIEGYLGPWAKYADEETVSKPADEDAAYLEEYLAKRQKKGKREEEVPMEEKSTLHIKDDKDYQGRSFLHVPQDLGINLKSDEPPARCFIPKRQIHTWTGHSKGISVIRWFPGSGHLMLSGSLDNKVLVLYLRFFLFLRVPRAFRNRHDFFSFLSSFFIYGSIWLIHWSGNHAFHILLLYDYPYFIREDKNIIYKLIENSKHNSRT